MEIIRLLDVCRLCLKQNSNLLDIFTDKNVEGKLTKVFKFAVLPHLETAITNMKPITITVPFQIVNHEQLSPLICLACYELILRFYDYSKTVCQNQIYLDDLLCKYSIPETGTDDISNEDDIQTKVCIQKQEPHVAVVKLAPGDDADEVASLEPRKAPRRTEGNEDDIQTNVSIPQEEFHVAVVELAPGDDVDEVASLEPRKTSRRTKGDALINEYMILICDICDESKPVVFDNFKLLQEHFQRSHNTAGYAVCCGRKFVRKDRLITHITNHIDPKAFRCNVCDHISKSRYLLRVHTKQHLSSAERQFGCGKCEQKFVLRSQLVNHEASHLEDSEKKHICDICGKAFALKFVLMKHKQLHTATAKEFVCEICAKSVSSKASLKAHMDSHCDEAHSRLQCDVCSRWYKNAETLRTHIRVRHHDQRTHRCNPCGKIFPSKSSLAAHVKYVHVREAKFGCEQCDKNFRKKVELKEHIARVHKGKSLYQCEFCRKTFSCSSNYFSHRKTKHPKEYAQQQLDRSHSA